MKEKIYKIWGTCLPAGRFFLDLLFPPVCLVCRNRFKITNTSESTNSDPKIRIHPNLQNNRFVDSDKFVASDRSFAFLCSECSQKIQINNSLFCPVCSARLPKNKNTCLRRQVCHKNSSFVLGAAGFYGDEILDNLIGLLKYQRIKTAAVPLAEILSDYLLDLNLDLKKFILIPIPLYRLRERRRGFNQTVLLAKHLTKNIGLTITLDVLERTRNTASQVELKTRERREINVRNCFSVLSPGLISGRDVILLDDVSTTGATMKEAALALKKAGAKEIIGLVVAKTRI